MEAEKRHRLMAYNYERARRWLMNIALMALGALMALVALVALEEAAAAVGVRQSRK